MKEGSRKSGPEKRRQNQTREKGNSELEDMTKKAHLMGGQSPILSDEDILTLSEYTPFSEGETVYFEDDGEPACGFWGAAQEVAAASAAQAAKLKTGQARTLFHMRSFYLLGVLRGAEAYRSMLTDEAEEHREIPFSLDELSAEDFREDLEQIPPEMFKRLCALLGIAVSWTDIPQKPKRRKH